MDQASLATMATFPPSTPEQVVSIAAQNVGPSALGPFIKALRLGQKMTLRDVEEATLREVSNAYLSQLENSKISKPSPHILHTLSRVLGASYEALMERAGYIATERASAGEPGDKRPQAGYSIENLTGNEEKELLQYLAFLRSKKGRRAS
jgi:transcriptional regulator with XRE-family HTH domain